MFGRLLPKEGRFFDLFNAHADQIVRAAHAVKALMENRPSLGRNLPNMGSPAFEWGECIPENGACPGAGFAIIRGLSLSFLDRPR